ncbi:MAG: ATP-binding protein [Chloroflexota bacterium]
MESKVIKALLIEDNPGDARLLWETLKEATSTRVHLIHVQRLSQALECLREGSYDVILMDLGLPDSHGLNTIIQTREQAPGAAIVVLTGLEDEALALEALRQGAQDYLTKTQMDPHLLIRSIRYAMERKRGEEQILRLNEDLEQRVLQRTTELEAIQSSMTEGLIAVNSQGQIVTFNQSAANITGLEAERVLGNSAEIVLSEIAPAVGSPETVEAFVQILKGAVELPTSVEVTLQAPRKRDIVATAFPIPLGLPGQRMIGFLLRDVTQERKLERRRDTFVSVASHELRTPITTIMGFSELLLRHKVPEATRQEWLELVHRESQKLTAIVDDLLNVSRIQAGTLKANMESVSLREVAEETLDNIRRLTDRHQFLINIPPTTPNTWADRGKLCEVLVNLLDNAVKYSPQGGLVTIEARHEPEQEWVEVSVADQGIGISPKDQEYLFTAFHQIRRPETEGISSTGLGMYIVKALVELMQGEVWLKSELNKGTTFFFSLPVAWDDTPQG